MSTTRDFEPGGIQGPFPSVDLGFSEYFERSNYHANKDKSIDLEYDEDGEGQESSFLNEQKYHTYDPENCPILEDFEQYKPGGHHPVVLGDFLGEDNRFQVWHKMGQGTYGLVWLCRDLAEGKFCAVKVLRDDFSKHGDKLPELRLGELLGGVSDKEAWDNHIVMPLDTFTHRGPNGEHLCIAMPVLGPSISESRTYNWNNLPLLKDICFQLVEGMNFMHTHGLCHGDFRPSNILFKTTLGDLTEEEMEIYLPEPRRYEIVMAREYDNEPRCGPHAPAYAVEPLHLTLEDDCITKEIAIIDFGDAFEVGQPTNQSAIPDKYASPECQREVGSRPSIGSDLWALGCTITEILTGVTPFEFAGGFSFEELEGKLGPMPEPHRTKFVEYCKGGHSSYRLQNTSKPTLHLLWDTKMLERWRKEASEECGTEDMLHETLSREAVQFHPDVFREPPKTISEEVLTSKDVYKRPVVPDMEGPKSGTIKRRLDFAAIPGAVDLLTKVLRWLPEDRVAANNLLEHEWFEGRSHEENFGEQQSKGPTFEDILMEEIPLSTELSVKKEDLPPPPEVAGAGALVGPQTWRLNEIDLLHAGPFVPKSIWGFFQKALCVKPRK